jgi:hypothetical protein
MKYKTEPLAEVRGITITTSYLKQKNGKELLWIEMRQKNGKRWKMYSALAYGRSADVCFIAEPETKILTRSK